MEKEQNKENMKSRDRLISLLNWDSRIDSRNLQVEVSKNGVAQLSGFVSSYPARQAAESNAWTIPNVCAVENLISIRYSENGALFSDEEIYSNLTNTFLWNPNIHLLNLRMRVKKGCVVLEGTVDSYWKKLLVETVAYDIAGVVCVENEVSVVPAHTFTDRAIREAITGNLQFHPEIEITEINIHVENGTVSMTGQVPTWRAYQDIIKAVGHTSGVKEIHNNLLIKRI